MGPLNGIRILEIAGIGPGPFAAMLLADLGAEVLRVDRAQNVRENPQDVPADILNRGRRSVGFDLKNPEAREALLRMVEGADALIEGFRPGVMERLGIGPEVCLERNPRLLYGRMTGFGQDGPMAHAAGHDINYIAMSGALHSIGHKGGRPVPPLNLVGDFGGGGLMLAFGIVCGIVERARSGKGQVIDAAMVDGSATLMGFIFGLQAMGGWNDERGTNILDTAAHFYDTYETSDGKYVSIGSIEPQFYAELLEKTGLGGEDLPQQMDKSGWDSLKERLTGIFKSKTRDEWCAIMEGSDVCFAPVLSLAEAPRHPHNVARKTFIDVEGIVQPAPAPRFDRTPGEISRPAAQPGQHTAAALGDWGFSSEEIHKLTDAGAIK
jgi:alpha-methylacyl-CoA racemase